MDSSSFKIIKAAENDFTLLSEAAKFASLLYKADVGGMERELAELISGGAAVFVCFEGEEPAGFAQCGLRRDYVEGTQGGRPVGYLEGVYVRPESRGHGAARAMLAVCEDWARSRGAREFASDCELDNVSSAAFHAAAGFREANRIVCFVKEL